MSEAGVALFRSIVKRTWDALGNEILQAIAEAEDRSYATWEEVIQTVFDCDHWRMYGLTEKEKKEEFGFVQEIAEMTYADLESLFLFVFGKAKWI